jgi:hypothetical protein
MRTSLFFNSPRDSGVLATFRQPKNISFAFVFSCLVRIILVIDANQRLKVAFAAKISKTSLAELRDMLEFHDVLKRTTSSAR